MNEVYIVSSIYNSSTNTNDYQIEGVYSSAHLAECALGTLLMQYKVDFPDLQVKERYSDYVLMDDSYLSPDKETAETMLEILIIKQQVINTLE